MSKFFEKHKTKQILGISEQKMHELTDWLYIEIEDAISMRRQLDKIHQDCLKMYEGVPKLESRNVPIEGAPNIEVTIGAIAADTIYAQAIDLIFNIAPFITARAKPKFKNDREAENNAKVIQKFANHIASSPDAGLRAAIETSILDDVQLGTGITYIPWIEKVKKTKSAKVLSVGPRFYSIPLEDIIIPAGSYTDLDDFPFVALRFYRTLHDLRALSEKNRWNIDGIQPIHSKSSLRITRENLARTSEPSNIKGTLYDIYNVYCHFDVDGDGLEEDLLVIWNHSGRKILSVTFCPNDRRPIEKMVYQARAHLFYGLGVLQMMMPYEEKLSDIHNYATLNILLANARVWVGSEGLDETMKIWPGKYIQTPNPREDLQALQMADVYNSIWQDQMITMQLANQRVGINDVSRGSDIPSRTPGITAMSFIQQVNRRFVPAFDSMRNCASGMIRQALYRYQEKLLLGDKRAEESILEILGYEDGLRVINLLRNEKFDEEVDVELTASSTSINREADKQNSIMLTNILGQYYQRTLELISVAANPQTPPAVRSIVEKIISSASEVIDRTMRTFDQVRDPAAFIVDVEQELNQIETDAQSQQALGQLMSMIGGAAAGGGGGGGAAALEQPSLPPQPSLER